MFVAKIEWIIRDSYFAIRAKEQDHWECQFEYKRKPLNIYSQNKIDTCLWTFVRLTGGMTTLEI